jgi:16S rRNA (uracil1498-N3)-methyltransferase
MHYFLDTAFSPKLGKLNEEESRHAIKSLRLKIGDGIKIGDGNGNLYHCTIRSLGKNELKVDVTDTITAEAPKRKLIVAIPPTKNISRFEWFLEKSTEMGIGEIVPMLTKRTERPRLKMDRAHRIVHAAGKQSLQPFLPILHELTYFEDVCKIEAQHKFMAHCEEGLERVSLVKALKETGDSGDVLMLIGPEGDFTKEEIGQAKAAGFKAVELGPHRLRTETAGVFSVSVWLGGR